MVNSLNIKHLLLSNKALPGPKSDYFLASQLLARPLDFPPDSALGPEVLVPNTKGRTWAEDVPLIRIWFAHRDTLVPHMNHLFITFIALLISFCLPLVFNWALLQKQCRQVSCSRAMAAGRTLTCHKASPGPRAGQHSSTVWIHPSTPLQCAWCFWRRQWKTGDAKEASEVIPTLSKRHQLFQDALLPTSTLSVVSLKPPLLPSLPEKFPLLPISPGTKPKMPHLGWGIHHLKHCWMSCILHTQKCGFWRTISQAGRLEVVFCEWDWALKTSERRAKDWNQIFHLCHSCRDPDLCPSPTLCLSLSLSEVRWQGYLSTLSWRVPILPLTLLEVLR